MRVWHGLSPRVAHRLDELVDPDGRVCGEEWVGVEEVEEVEEVREREGEGGRARAESGFVFEQALSRSSLSRSLSTHACSALSQTHSHIMRRIKREKKERREMTRRQKKKPTS